MRKALLVCTICLFLAIYFSGCHQEFIAPSDTLPIQLETTEHTGDEQMEQNYRLIVKGKDITGEYSIQKKTYSYFYPVSGKNIESHYIMLPYIAILEELGAEVEWQDTEIAIIKFQGREYTLNTIKGTMTEPAYTNRTVLEGGNYLFPGWGGGGQHFEIINSEFFLDDASVRGSLFLMGSGITVHINSDKTITIE